MDETQKILIKAGRKDLAQKYYEKVAGGYSIIEPKSIEEMMEMSKGTNWSIIDRRLAERYFGKVVFVMRNNLPVAAVDTRDNRIFDRKDYPIKTGPIFDFVQENIFAKAASSTK